MRDYEIAGIEPSKRWMMEMQILLQAARSRSEPSPSSVIPELELRFHKPWTLTQRNLHPTLKQRSTEGDFGSRQ